MKCERVTCSALTHELSSTEKYRGEFENYPTYTKTTKWLCDNGHTVTVKTLVDTNGKLLR